MGFFKRDSIETTVSSTPVTTTRSETEVRQNTRDGITFWSETPRENPTASDATTTVEK